MSDEEFGDPLPPAESSGLRGDDLLNKICVFYPREMGEYAPTPAQDGKEAMKGGPYVVCEVWVIGLGGVEEHDSAVRISWWRSVPGLKARIGSFIQGQVKVNEDRSRTIMPLTEQAKAAIGVVRDQILAERDATDAALGESPAGDLAEHSSEPF